MDQIDRKLLSALKHDSQARYVDLAKTVHLSAPAIHERVKKLRRVGAIRRFTIDVDAPAIGFPVCAFVHVKLRGVACPAVIDTIRQHREIEECHTIAGPADIVLKVRTHSAKALELFLVDISAIAGVAGTECTVVLDTYIDSGSRIE